MIFARAVSFPTFSARIFKKPFAFIPPLVTVLPTSLKTGMLSPVIAEIAEEHPEIKVCKVNVDSEMELASQFNVMSIPFVAVFKNGNLTASSVGYQPKENILNLLN